MYNLEQIQAEMTSIKGRFAHMKKLKFFLITLLVIVILWTQGPFIYYVLFSPEKPTSTMDINQCIQSGGYTSCKLGVVDYTSSYPVYGAICKGSDKAIANVTGYQCYSVCCIPKDTLFLKIKSYF